MDLNVKNLTKIYRKQSLLSSKVFKALDGISFDVKSGESLSIIGESGSGKTTLGKILSCILPFENGEILYDNKNISGYNFRQRSCLVQMIFQNPYMSLNPRLKIGGSLKEASTDESDIIKTLNSLNLDKDVLNKFPHQFSGGQRQRIAIARVLLKRPKFIVADEPFSSLDASAQVQIMEILKNIANSSSVLFITHDIAAAAYLTEKSLILKDGIIIYNGKLKEAGNANHPYIQSLIEASQI
ncbi:MAG: dipeptide/oligopeptide/nickel ABC transporter ATP-binding protein [Elusimicrobia bacterium]|nr:dipeptide/oligopeptide/nickel ABC transporter ATP-binding protein [Elusimicrobiota bacterium]